MIETEKVELSAMLCNATKQNDSQSQCIVREEKQLQYKSDQQYYDISQWKPSTWWRKRLMQKTVKLQLMKWSSWMNHDDYTDNSRSKEEEREFYIPMMNIPRVQKSIFCLGSMSSASGSMVLSCVRAATTTATVRLRRRGRGSGRRDEAERFICWLVVW